jgi:hypothetical protein
MRLEMESNFNKFSVNSVFENSSKTSDLYLREIEFHTKSFLKSQTFKKKRISNIENIHRIKKIPIPYRKYFNNNLNISERIINLDKYNTELTNFFSSDRDFQIYEQTKKRINSLIISNPIEFTIENNTNFNLSNRKVSKDEAESIILSINTKDKKQKSKMVYEEEFAFSDDSVDSDICPINTSNKAELGNMQILSDVFLKNKKTPDINSEIKKKKNSFKLKLQLEKDFMIVLSMVKKLKC